MNSARNGARQPSDHCTTLHEPFLERAADRDDERSKAEALGGFLTLRMVDSIAHSEQRKQSVDSLEYQANATTDFIAQLSPRTVAVNHMAEIVRVARRAVHAGTIRVMWPPMLAFAYWLEQDARYAESLDVLETALRLSDGRAAEEEVATQLQRARVLRRIGRFDDASAGYAAAGALALQMADRRSELLSRIGRAIVYQKVGNLPASEDMLRTVLDDARAIEDRDAEARASHDLAVALALRERPAEAVPYAFRAYELYEQPGPRARALSDAGGLLKLLGHYSAAKDALCVVVGSAPPTDILLRAELELLDLGALMGDRLSFERWRRELQSDYELMAVDTMVDFELTLGSGYTLFGRMSDAETALQQAVQLAERHGLGERLFRADQGLNDVRARCAHVDAAAALPQAPTPSPELQQTIDRIQTLRVSLEAAGVT